MVNLINVFFIKVKVILLFVLAFYVFLEIYCNQIFKYFQKYLWIFKDIHRYGSDVMGDYFSLIVSSLPINDLKVLGVLSDSRADAVFKSMKRKDLQEQVVLTDALFRKSLERLEANQFIQLVTKEKEYKVFITPYGLLALNESLREEM